MAREILRKDGTVNCPFCGSEIKVYGKSGTKKCQKTGKEFYFNWHSWSPNNGYEYNMRKLKNEK